MDFPRYYRALKAREVDRIEGKLPEFFAGKWQPEAREWRIIQRDNQLSEDHA